MCVELKWMTFSWRTLSNYYLLLSSLFEHEAIIKQYASNKAFLIPALVTFLHIKIADVCMILAGHNNEAIVFLPVYDHRVCFPDSQPFYERHFEDWNKTAVSVRLIAIRVTSISVLLRPPTHMWGIIYRARLTLNTSIHNEIFWFVLMKCQLGLSNLELLEFCKERQNVNHSYTCTCIVCLRRLYNIMFWYANNDTQCWWPKVVTLSL